MTSPSFSSDADSAVGPTPAASAAPPPGCPAHGLGPGGLRRLFGHEAETDPMGLYERLRAEHGPVAPVLVNGDIPAWIVLGHRENMELARTPSRFSRDSRHWREMQEGKVPPDHPLAPLTTWQPIANLTEGEEHERYRKAITESMGRFDRRGIRRHVTRFANQLVDEFSADGRAELVSQFSEHLPMLAMTQLLGMPDEYGPRLVSAARDMLKGTETAVASNEYVVMTLRQTVANKREKPAQDFTTWLITHHSELSDEELEQHLRLVLIAAFETTANLITNTLRMVLTDHRFRANLAGGHMTLPDALEQVLWDEPPFITLLGRWATGDTELGGKPIRKGDLIISGLAAGNVDPEIRPDLSVPVHGNRSHLAFSGGPHECPGQDMARAIADTGIDALLARLPDLRLAVPEGELRWVSSIMSRHLVALPVEFSPHRAIAQGGTTGQTELPLTVATAGAPLPDAAVVAVAGVSEPQLRRSWWVRLLRSLRRH
ncbi:cytochrome P450 [Actinacidiphila oryziradicis]|uniref:cytochrome P450 n=1 Tax=Actinacidiphila oryziradicis TaxID=2571141 RepID=UPI0026C32358